ncbi:SurA N-terminal domain-containing protein [Candidatus Chromulinivorax destructor]|uniref:Periplasmic chaperone PpiD n=1 Tax=Candidatus Chromulinivorax destructor TaxID=2066483 RepID=A0A345ZA56_9BACT|nr:peptidylprolyl isomerase [Candidatus Chromulinivorax destructor]AXK60173.1 hypothetical protein C0J27_00205 [Candidatus Chromulinivorax destructor]
MITSLRRSLKSNAYRIFLWMFLAIMLFGGLSFDFTDKSKWAIKVYKQKMMDLDWYHALITSQKQLDYIASLGINWPRTEPLDKEVLRNSIKKLLLQHNAQELDLRVPSVLVQDQLAAALQGLPEYFFDASGRLNVAMLEKQLAPRTFESFVDEIENEIKANLIHNIVDLSSSYVPSFEVASQYTQDYADKKYTVLTFSLQKALEHAKKNEVSDEVLERFYKKSEHGDAYKTTEKRAGNVWKFSAHDYGISVNDQEILAYYDEHKQSDYLESPVQLQVRRIYIDAQVAGARDIIEAIREQVVADPALFQTLAKKINTEKPKGQGAQRTDFFAKDSTKYDAVLVQAAFEQLHTDLAISDVIKTDAGYEILQRVARKSAKYKTLSDVKNEISSMLLAQKFEKRFQQDAQRVAGHADYNNSQAVASFIEKRKGHKEHISLESRKSDVISMHLFQTDKDHYAVFMDGKHGILLQCTDVSKKTLKPFDQIKSTVLADYYAKQAQQNLQTVAADAMKDALSVDVQELAKKYDAQLSQAHFAYQHGKVESSDLLHRPEIAQKVRNLEVVGEMVDVVTSTESFLIILDEVAPIDKKIFAEKELMIKNTLSSKAKYKGRDSFIASLYRRAKLNSKIEIKDQLLKDAKETV